jgi:hypothetical protein
MPRRADSRPIALVLALLLELLASSARRRGDRNYEPAERGTQIMALAPLFGKTTRLDGPEKASAAGSPNRRQREIAARRRSLV